MANIKQGRVKVLSYLITQPFTIPFQLLVDINKSETYKVDITITINWSLSAQQTISDLQIKFNKPKIFQTVIVID